MITMVGPRNRKQFSGLSPVKAGKKVVIHPKILPFYMDGFPICRSTLSNATNSPVQKYLFSISYKYGIEHSYDDLSKHVSSNSWKTEILCNKFKEGMSSYRLQGHELCR